jgi:energy-coupling factor transporter ATP-binding protein EcfA2
MDFYSIRTKEMKDGTIQVYPDWIIGRSKDLMVRGKGFYAIWDEERNIWSTDEYDVQRLVDADVAKQAKEMPEKPKVMSLRSFNSTLWTSFRKFMAHVSDNSHPLDETLTFQNTEVKKSDHVSRRLPYSLEPGSTAAWDELVEVLYSDEERAKFEWAIGAIIAGDGKKIQKFLVFYGPAGSGKSTILNIVQKLFEGYVAVFDAKALGSSNNSFATEAFKSNPLVAVQHDGDLSTITDNTKLNSIISHEELNINEKYRPMYSARINALLFMGTNQPVRISDAKSGILRRLIDIHPTGARIEPERYQMLMNQIDFELGAIAHKCLVRYMAMGKNYYNTYRAEEMQLQTDVFYNFVEAYFDVFSTQEGISLRQAYSMYKEFCNETGIDRVIPQYKFREELRNYFHEFKDREYVDGALTRSYYKRFRGLERPTGFVPDSTYVIELDKDTDSVFDRIYAGQPAQYAKPSGGPGYRWAECPTTLADLDTSKVHWVQVPREHIVIDFDLVDEDGERSIEKNIEAASKLPATYTELSRSGKGIHLHYIYAGDVGELASVYDVGVEVKTLLGDSALRRKLTKCNSLDITTLTSGLPLKERRVIDQQSIQSERGLRDLIDRNLRKEIHPGTKPSIDFIHKILEDAYNSGLAYDVQDMRPIILAFAAKSTHQSLHCVKVVSTMKFVGQNEMAGAEAAVDEPLAIYDVEVFPNLFVVCWKFRGKPDVVRMINPTPQEVEALFRLKLVGFNNRRYDNHILYARYLGYTNEELFHLSQKIIVSSNSNALFGEAFNLSYADIFDFSSEKKSLAKFQIALGLYHLELDIPWDQPVPEELWDKVVEYCVNDVVSTEAVLDDREQDFVARQILAHLSGLPVNSSTLQHTARIIFGEEKNPQDQFVYTDLSKQFKGYKYEGGVSTYHGEEVGEGGYVYAEPGIYENVALLDIASMHPTSIVELDLFGPYTARYAALKEARLAIKSEDYDRANNLLGGQLGELLGGSENAAESLAYALKIVLNTVYGVTTSSFANPFRDPRNIDNIVAKRGSLFMVDLKRAVQRKGWTVAHIKTDSIKLPDATQEMIDFVVEFGRQYGYEFVHEKTFDKFCLVNDAVYIGRAKGQWTAVGAQFQHPYVFKKLFTGEPVEFDDYCEVKSVVQGAMYLDFTGSDDVADMIHIGRTGVFVPVTENGGTLWRVKDDKKYAVTGTKNHRWIERSLAWERLQLDELYIDMDYFEGLRNAAFEAIDYYGAYSRFIE